jgi:hypothetical protein
MSERPTGLRTRSGGIVDSHPTSREAPWGNPQHGGAARGRRSRFWFRRGRTRSYGVDPETPQPADQAPPGTRVTNAFGSMQPGLPRRA